MATGLLRCGAHCVLCGCAVEIDRHVMKGGLKMKTERKITGTGWLSPDGEFVSCPSYAHISTARDIVEKIGTATKYKWNLRYNSPDGVLYGNGWISVEIRQIGDHGFEFCRNHYAPVTDIQAKMLREFAEKDDVKDFMTEYGRQVLQNLDDYIEGGEQK